MAAGITYEPIATQTLSSTTSSITFSSISQSYTDLVLVVNNLKHSYAGSTVVRDDFLQFNGDTAGNYSLTMLYGDGSSAATLRGSGQSAIVSDYAMASAAVGSTSIININNYSNSTTHKTILQRCNNVVDRTSVKVNLWRNTAAITSIKIGPSGSYTMAAGSTFTLYGIAAA